MERLSSERDHHGKSALYNKVRTVKRLCKRRINEGDDMENLVILIFELV